MQTSIIKIVEDGPGIQLPEEVLTLKYFVDFIRREEQTAGAHKQHLLSFIIKKFESHPEVEQPIAIENICRYAELLQLIHIATSPMLADNNVHCWGLSMPVSPTIFFSSDALFEVLGDFATGRLKKNMAELDEKEMIRSQLESCYSLLLQRCYNLDTLFNQGMIYPVEEEVLGLPRYFKIDFDNRFVHTVCKGPLPELDLESDFFYDRKQLLDYLLEKLPLSLFRFEGLLIMSVTDITPQHAAEKIKALLIDHSGKLPEQYYHSIIKSLKTLARNSNIEFSIYPLVKVNNRYIFDDHLLYRRNDNAPSDGSKTSFIINFSAENFLANPRLIFVQETDKARDEEVINVEILRAQNIISYVLLPVYSDNKLCGVLEISSTIAGLINKDLLPRVETALPYLSQIFKKNIEEFENEIESVIKRNFTSLQPSVQWKFNEVAWQYIEDRYKKGQQAELDTIAFGEVYPLYGSIDIRNSTILRNEAMRKDLKLELNLLIETLENLKLQSGFGLIDEKIFQCRKWLGRVAQNESFDQENRIAEFIESDIIPFLSQFKKGDPRFAHTIDKYFSSIDESTGEAKENRRMLESAMTEVITVVNQYVEEMKDHMQKAYPCYFEKFRSDGIEYDIYLGQSVAPDRPFSGIYLSNLRLLQLSYMAVISRHTYSLLRNSVRPVETTHLIYIHSHPLDIRFRTDEKRFDVEGAYNIRYQIIKKRIDKVNILGTRERLTVPNKIALVYLNPKEAEEYAEYILYLQEKGLLENDLEYLELEQLQGVSGLKAMRVSVVVNDEKPAGTIDGNTDMQILNKVSLADQ
jgi:hypothetical protein